MAEKGDKLHSPTLGETIEFVRTTRETGGALLEVEATYEPKQRWEQGVSHYHPRQDESFTILAGEMSVRMGGQEKSYVAGERFDIPRGVVHLMRNLGAEPARVNWQIRPALNTEAFFETVWGLSADGKLKEGTLGYLLQFALVLRTFRDEFRVTSPPPLVQTLVLPLLAFLGRLRGYQGMYVSTTSKQAGAAIPPQSE